MHKFSKAVITAATAGILLLAPQPWANAATPQDQGGLSSRAVADSTAVTPSAGSVASEIIARNRQFSAAFAAQNAGRLAALYTPDAVLYPSGQPPFVGRAAIRQFFRGAFAAGLRTIQLQTRSVDRHGDFAVEYSSYTLRLGNGVVADSGTYQVVWKKVLGTWYLHRDFIRSHAPCS